MPCCRMSLRLWKPQSMSLWHSTRKADSVQCRSFECSLGDPMCARSAQRRSPRLRPQPIKVQTETLASWEMSGALLQIAALLGQTPTTEGLKHDPGGRHYSLVGVGS